MANVPALAPKSSKKMDGGGGGVNSCRDAAQLPLEFFPFSVAAPVAADGTRWCLDKEEIGLLFKK